MNVLKGLLLVVGVFLLSAEVAMSQAKSPQTEDKVAFIGAVCIFFSQVAGGKK